MSFSFFKRDGKVGDVRKSVAKVAGELESTWHHAPAFIDVRIIKEAGIETSDGDSPLLELLARETRRSLPLVRDPSNLVPVTGISRDRELERAIAAIVEEDKTGACIRVSADEFNEPMVETKLEGLLSRLKLDLVDVDLIVDLGFVNGSSPDLEDLRTTIPQLTKWRTFTLLSGAFPKDLQELEKDSVQTLPRNDWLNYTEQVQRISRNGRRPTYGDYTVQHATFAEPPKGCNPSASIRYTHEDYWVVMRGHGLTHKGSVGNAQYPAEAQLLCGMDEFCGQSFSAGDEYIYQASRGADGPGTPRTWIRAGINHHLTYTARQVSRVPVPSRRSAAMV